MIPSLTHRLAAAITLACCACGPRYSLEPGSSEPEGIPEVFDALEAITARDMPHVHLAFAHAPVACPRNTPTKYAGCYEYVAGEPHLTIGPDTDWGDPYGPAADARCTTLAHELVHRMFGDHKHADPALWYAEHGLVRRVLERVGCTLTPP